MLRITSGRVVWVEADVGELTRLGLAKEMTFEMLPCGCCVDMVLVDGEPYAIVKNSNDMWAIREAAKRYRIISAEC